MWRIGHLFGNRKIGILGFQSTAYVNVQLDAQHPTPVSGLEKCFLISPIAELIWGLQSRPNSAVTIP